MTLKVKYISGCRFAEFAVGGKRGVVDRASRSGVARLNSHNQLSGDGETSTRCRATGPCRRRRPVRTDDQ